MKWHQHKLIFKRELQNRVSNWISFVTIGLKIVLNIVIKEVTFSPFIGQICFVWSKLHTHQQLQWLN
jgi:hypothetical protein